MGVVLICPCSPENIYEKCCQPLHVGEINATTSLQLMKSRYSAFALKLMDYIKQTHDPQTRKDFNPEEAREWAHIVTFTQLEILNFEESGNKGFVEFKAHFQNSEGTHIHHEKSVFRRQNEIWYYRSSKN